MPNPDPMVKADFRLTAAEREWICHGSEPWRYQKWMTRLTEERKKELDERFSLVDEQVHLFMDSHGCNQCLCIFEDLKGDGELYAFQYCHSSEETFFGEWEDLEENDRLTENSPVFKVRRQTKTIVDYVHPSGEDIKGE